MSDMAAPASAAAVWLSNAEMVLGAFLAGRSETTLRAYRQDMEHFRRFVGAPTLALATERLLRDRQGQANALVLSYRAWMLEQNLSPATINRRLAALRSLSKLARVLGYIDWQIETPNLRAESYRDTRGPGRDGFRKLLATLAARKDTPGGRRDRAILRLLYDLGLRRGEVVALDLADVEAGRGTLLVQGKGRREKTPLTLAGPTAAALNEWLAVRGTAPGPLFTSFDRAGKGSGRLTASCLYKNLRALGVAADVPAARPHGLRHTAITEACKAAQAAGIGLEEVLDFSRHRDVRVLMLYRDRDRNVQGQIAALIADDV